MADYLNAIELKLHVDFPSPVPGAPLIAERFDGLAHQQRPLLLRYLRALR